MREKLFLLVFCIISCCSYGICENYYVDAVGGSDSNSGRSADDAWHTISYALSNVDGTEGDPAVINIASGSYNISMFEAFPLSMKSHTSLIGEDPENTILDASGAETSVITIMDVADVSINSLKLTGGWGYLIENPYGENLLYRLGGGIYCVNSSSITISNCFITDNYLTCLNDQGGGIYCYLSDPVMIEDCILSYNISGGIYCKESSPTISGCEISYNSYGATVSGGIYCEEASPSIRDCLISNNFIAGIRLKISSPLITNCTIKDNHDSGIFLWRKSNPSIIDCEISGNYALQGGGINCFSYQSNPEIRNCSIKDNFAEYKGGGIYCYDQESVVLENCTISNNSSNFGAGIYSNLSSLKIDKCKIYDNSGTGEGSAGGGIYFRGEFPIILENCEISGNTANYGGGIHLFSSTNSHAVNCLFLGNLANNYGGAFHIVSSKTNITNCTIVNNTAQIMEGGISISSGNTEIMNTIIWDNQGGSIGGNVPASIRYCDIEDGYPGEGNINEDPLFVVGARGDYYLSQVEAGEKVNSPCVDTGNSAIPPSDFTPSTCTTRTDGVFDTGRADIGYHYSPHIQFDLEVKPERTLLSGGDSLQLLFDLNTGNKTTSVDIYLLLYDPEGNYYSGLIFDRGLTPMVSNYTLPANRSLEEIPLLEILIPSQKPPIRNSGSYSFVIAATISGTGDIISNIAEVNFAVE